MAKTVVSSPEGPHGQKITNWGWPPTRGDGGNHVGMATHTWGWPLTPGDGRFTRGDGHSHVGMAGLNLGTATHTWGWRIYVWGWPKKNCRKKRIPPPGLRSFRETPVLS